MLVLHARSFFLVMVIKTCVRCCFVHGILRAHYFAGSFRAVVTDGITLGRPCCKVHNCTRPLPSNRAHFCIEHASKKKTCVVNDCRNQTPDGYQTCNIPAHRELEDRRKERGKAFFQLCQRLQRHNTSQLSDSMSAPDVQEFDDDTVHKSDSGNQQPKARFSHRRTHNEQLVVACCGVILGRGTMFGAEAISGIKVSNFLVLNWYPTQAIELGFP